MLYYYIGLVFSPLKGVYMGKDLKGKELGIGLNQRKDGRYQARFTKRNGSRAEKNFNKISEARDWLSKEKYLDTCLHSNKTTMTVDDWFNFWIDNYKKGIVRYNTEKNYRNRYQNSIKSKIGNMSLNEVRHLDCQNIINKMFENCTYSRGTIELTAITLHAIFKGAVENELIIKNPANNLKLREEIEIQEKRVLTVSEERILLEYCKNSLYYNMFSIILETGLRCGEAGGLQWSDIDFENKCLKVERALHYRGDKNEFAIGAVKTKQSKRKIPLTDKTIACLENQRTLIKKMSYKNPKWDNDWDGLVFRSKNGKPIGNGALNTSLARIVKNINKDRIVLDDDNYQEFKTCTVHSLRHTFATRCIEKGVQPKTLQKMLGHSTIQVTMDLYVHVTDEYLENEVKKMNKAI